MENKNDKLEIIVEESDIETTLDGFVIETTKSGEKTLIKYKGTATQVQIPEGVKFVGDEAFSGCENLEKIILPASIKFIGNRAFSNCTSLKSITLPEGIKIIGKNAFYDCRNLEEIKLPPSLEYIGERAFSDCKSLTKISLPTGVKKIGNAAFSGCRSLEEISLPPNISCINTDLFFYCISLKSITLPECVKRIGENAFSGCKSLREIKLSKGIKYIGRRAFSVCESLGNISIPEGVSSIENETFFGCRKIEEIELPESIRSIGQKAFACCNALKKINIPASVSSIERETFLDCRGIEEIELPESIKEIWSRAFFGCSSLKKLTLPRNVRKIGEESFFNCDSLREIIIFKSLEDDPNHIFNFNVNEGFEYINEKDYLRQSIIGKIKYKELTFCFSRQNISSVLKLMREENIIAQKDELPIYIESSEFATQILKQIFKNTPKEKIKINILDKYNEEAFLSNIRFLNHIVPENITDEEKNNIIANMITNNPQLLNAKIEETVINNYQYLVNQKILSEEEMYSYYFGLSPKRQIEQIDENVVKEALEYAFRIKKENSPLLLTLVVNATTKKKLELRDRLLLTSCISYDDIEERIELLRGNSFETICRNDERDFVDEIGASSETFLTGYSKFKGIKTSLYRKLRGMSIDLVNDINKLAVENPQNIFTNFLNSLETTKNWELFDSEIERANYFRNEFIGRILYAYLKLVKQIKKEKGLEGINFTKKKDNQQHETLNPKRRYRELNISIEDIIREATKSQEELFDDPELIEVMLQINPYSYDALRNYATNDPGEFCIYAQLAKQYGYLFKKEEKREILKKTKKINKDKFMQAESLETFIEYVNNQLGLTKVSKKQQEKYLKHMKTILAKYIFDSNEENTMEILRTVDLYCRINNETEFQINQGYVYTAEALFDTTRIEEFSHEDRIMYCLFFMNKLAHNNKDINLIASIKDDYRFAGLSERLILLKKAVDGYSRLEKSGLTIDSVNTLLAKFEVNKANNHILQYLTSTTSDLNELIDNWCNFSNRIYHSYQALGTEQIEMIPTDQEIKEIINIIRTKLPYLNEKQKEIVKTIFSPTPIGLTEDEKKEKALLEQKEMLTEEEKSRLSEIQIKEAIINATQLTAEEKKRLSELQTKEKNYRVLEAMEIPNLEKFKLTQEEMELLNNLSNRNNMWIIKQIRNVSDSLLPIANLSETEAKEIKGLAEEYHVFFDIKTALSTNLINIFMKKEEQTLLFALSLDKKGKKEFYKKHGYIIEIQETDNGPTLVCLNKKLTKPFSVHLKNMSPELVEAIEKISISGITPTIAHTNSESSGQYPTLRQGKVNKPDRNDKQNIKVTAGFTCKGNREWRNYLVSIFNFAQYEYDEVCFIKEEIEQSENEQRECKLEELFSVICERIKNNPQNINNMCKIFIDSLSQNGYEYTVNDLKKDLKNQCLNPQELLIGSDTENNERLESLIDLYAQYNPNMVDIITEERDGEEKQFICIKGEISKKSGKINVEEKIDIDRFSSEFITKIKQKKHMEPQTQSESNPKTISSLNIEVPSTISAIAESKDGIVMNRGQVQGNANSNTQNKPPSM